jgi:hypothetical protein
MKHDSPAIEALMHTAMDNKNPEFQSRSESMEQLSHGLANPSAAEEHDEMGDTDAMSHSSKVKDSHHPMHGEVSHGMHMHEHDSMHDRSKDVQTSKDKKPRTIKEAAGMHRKAEKVKTSHNE